VPRTVAVMAVASVGLDWLELLLSDAAQQLSASACVGTLCCPAPCESTTCIMHSASSTQHAMRASGVGIHPAQIAAFPAIRPNVSARAANRWTNISTSLECSPAGGAVKPVRNVPVSWRYSQLACFRMAMSGTINGRALTFRPTAVFEACSSARSISSGSSRSRTDVRR